jgi:two-component system response regulator YesN
LKKPLTRELLYLCDSRFGTYDSGINSSAHEEFAWAQQAIRFGVDNYVVKPVDDVELIKTIKAVYCKTEKIRREMFQKNIDYLLLKNDCLFMERYQQLEDQLVLALRFLQTY